MEKRFSVAIDGPSGAGKSTIARACAKRFGFIYVDTGAIYRTVGLAVRRFGASPESGEEVSRVLPTLDIAMSYAPDGTQTMLLNGEDVSGLIRTPEMSVYASKVSALPEVRAFLLDMQRALAKRQSVVMDGRDIGTVVLPDAELKIFLTASPEKRAERRYRELVQRGEAVTFDEVLRDIKERDERDSKRAAAPLKKAGDAIELDTSGLSLGGSIEAVCRLIEERLGD